MTKINYSASEERIYFEANGHSDGQNGQVVCAAVSILILALAAELERRERNGDIRVFCGNVDSGYACFDVCPADSRCGIELFACFEMVIRSLEMLEEQYPDCVSVS